MRVDAASSEIRAVSGSVEGRQDMRRIGVVLAVSVAAFAVAGCTATTVPDTNADTSATRTASAAAATTKSMTDYLDGLVRVRQFRGSVEVRLGDRVLLSRGFDMARDGEPNGPDTRFGIGSVTKQFTALGVLMLQEQGKLRVGDRACTYLPDCPPAWRAITLDQLLTHTSGLYNYTDLSPAQADQFFARIGTREPSPAQLTGIFAGRPLAFAPGARWEYSNSGYVLLGRVIEKLAGQDYGRFLETAILDPLGMSGTGYTPGAAARPDDAVGYQGWTATAEVLDPSAFFAAGGMHSTTPDMARWNHFLLTGAPDVVEPDTLAQLLRPRVTAVRDERYGYGVMTRGTGDGTIHFHEGGVPGFVAHNEIRPATGLSVTVLSNLDSTDARRIGETLAHLAR
jgi:CubicO group peptidase (beta-lactamase class C family)